MDTGTWVGLIILTLIISSFINVPSIIPSTDIPIDGISIGMPDNLSEYTCVALLPLFFLSVCWGMIDWERNFVTIIFLTIEY